MQEVVDWFNQQPPVTQLIFMDDQTSLAARQQVALIGGFTQLDDQELLAWLKNNVKKVKFEPDPNKDMTPWFIQQSFSVAKNTRRARTNRAVEVSDGVVIFYVGKKPFDTPVGKVADNQFAIIDRQLTKSEDYFVHLVGNSRQIMQGLEAAYLAKDEFNNE